MANSVKCEKRLGLLQANRTCYLFLLVALLALMGIYPLFGPEFMERILLDLFLAGTLVTGSRRRFNLVLSVVSGSLMIVAHIAPGYLATTEWLGFTALAAGMVCFFHVSIILLHDIFSRRELVTVGLIYGVISGNRSRPMACQGRVKS